MKDRIKKYVDQLFLEIHDTRQLRELKEEISSNLLEKVNDFISKGDNENTSYYKAISSLGDMSELVESLKKASEAKFSEEHSNTAQIDRNHVIGYLLATAVILTGIIVGGILYLMQKDLFVALVTLTPFVLVAVPIFIYFGLTQETLQHFRMKHKRALAYSIASEIFLLGATTAGAVYFQGQKLYVTLIIFAPFLVASTITFLYLGLTEKSRSKMGPEWQNQWVNYYSNPKLATIRGCVSGALWMFAIAAFFLGGFNWGWQYSWIAFVIATGFEVLIEAVFAIKRK